MRRRADAHGYPRSEKQPWSADEFCHLVGAESIRRAAPPETWDSRPSEIRIPDPAVPPRPWWLAAAHVEGPLVRRFQDRYASRMETDWRDAWGRFLEIGRFLEAHRDRAIEEGWARVDPDAEAVLIVARPLIEVLCELPYNGVREVDAGTQPTFDAQEVFREVRQRD